VRQQRKAVGALEAARKVNPVTPEEEIEEKTVLALLGEYAAAQVELRQAEESLIAFAAKGTPEKGWASLVHRQFLAEDEGVNRTV
jgi:hypothetical protein